MQLSEILDTYKEYISKVIGFNADLYLSGIAKFNGTDKSAIDWINKTNKNGIDIIEQSESTIFIIHDEFDRELLNHHSDKVFLLTKDPKLLFAIIANDNFIKKKKPSIHSCAYIDPGASIANNVYIGPGCVIGKCSIGENTQISANVIINDNVIIGKNVIIKPGAVLGYEGFGFVKDTEGNLLKFPQVGRLIIHDNVEIGANTCIDRGSLVDTIIGKGTKISNLCQISHNVIIGENVIITGKVMISGSAVIKNNVWIAPNSSFSGHQTIGEGVVIGTGSVVLKDVPDNEIWAGSPARFLKNKNKG